MQYQHGYDTGEEHEMQVGTFVSASDSESESEVYAASRPWLTDFSFESSCSAESSSAGFVALSMSVLARASALSDSRRIFPISRYWWMDLRTFAKSCVGKWGSLQSSRVLIASRHFGLSQKSSVQSEPHFRHIRRAPYMDSPHASQSALRKSSQHVTNSADC